VLFGDKALEMFADELFPTEESQRISDSSVTQTPPREVA
jgi:hypothetical protein